MSWLRFSVFWHKNAPKFLISLTNPLTSISAEIFRKFKQVVNRSFLSTWFRLWLWLHYAWRAVETSRTASFAWTQLKLGVSVGVAYLAVQVEISFLRPCILYISLSSSSMAWSQSLTLTHSFNVSWFLASPSLISEWVIVRGMKVKDDISERKVRIKLKERRANKKKLRNESEVYIFLLSRFHLFHSPLHLLCFPFLFPPLL